MTGYLKKIRPVAMVFTSLCLAASFLLAAIVIVIHADHDCTGEGCHVCESIKAARDVLKRLVGELPRFAVVPDICPSFFLLSRFSGEFYANADDTPVSARVRLND
ncbi:MAG: hypothetical protein LBS93_04585 [Synergistaceae bacterium]|jgi:hypothetical protein|nr:hypothetical protein [Synergistaceae bacterium]